MRLTICSSLQIQPPHTPPPIHQSVFSGTAVPPAVYFGHFVFVRHCVASINTLMFEFHLLLLRWSDAALLLWLVPVSTHWVKKNTWRIIKVTAKHSTCITSSHTLRLSYRSSFWLFFLYYLSEWSHFMKYIGTGLKKYSILFSNKTLSYFPQALCVLCLL